MKETIASNIEWKKWGEKDPLMGVATRYGRDATGSDPWSEEEFYALGQSDWLDFYGKWKHYGVNTESCLEIGCGTGRITRQLALAFREVYAVDVSEDMISYAKKQVPADSVTFLVGDGVTIALPDRSVTAIFSTHVFQHFDSIEHASSYFAEAARVLKPGGSVMIHLPVHHWPAMPRVFDRLYQARKRLGDVRAWARRRFIRMGLSHHFMRGLSYSEEYLFDFLPSCGLYNVEICVFRTRKENVLHPFVFAQRDRE